MRTKTYRWQGAADPPIVCNTPVDPTVTPNPEITFTPVTAVPSVSFAGEWDVTGTLDLHLRSVAPGTFVGIAVGLPETSTPVFLANAGTYSFTYTTPTLGSWVEIIGTAPGGIQAHGFTQAPPDPIP